MRIIPEKATVALSALLLCCGIIMIGGAVTRGDGGSGDGGWSNFLILKDAYNTTLPDARESGLLAAAWVPNNATLTASSTSEFPNGVWGGMPSVMIQLLSRRLCFICQALRPALLMGVPGIMGLRWQVQTASAGLHSPLRWGWTFANGVPQSVQLASIRR